MTAVWATKDQAGGGMSSKLEVSEREYALLFKRKTWNDIVRASMFAAGEKFVADFLPLRFTNYARTSLGYNASRKKPGELPLVVTGRLRSGLLARAYPEARATSSNYSIIIRQPTPQMENDGKPTGYLYTSNPVVNRVLGRITTPEITAMSQVMGETLDALISGSSKTISKRGKTRMDLTVHQRASIAHTRKPQGSLHQSRPSIA